MSDHHTTNSSSVDGATAAEPTFPPLTGHCFCGQVSYVISSSPLAQGFCYCRDCQRVSASGFLPWMNVTASSFTLAGMPKIEYVRGTSIRGTEKVFGTCAHCGSAIFGGQYGVHEKHTVYAGTLDDDSVSRFKPTMALFVRERPAWAKVHVEMKEFDTLPGLS